MSHNIIVNNQIITVHKVLDYRSEADREYAEKYLIGTFVLGFHNEDLIHECLVNLKKTISELEIERLICFSYGFVTSEKNYSYIIEISIEPLIGKVFHEWDPILDQFVGKKIAVRDNFSDGWSVGIFSGHYSKAQSCPFLIGGVSFRSLKIIPESLEEPEETQKIIDGYVWHRGEKLDAKFDEVEEPA
jgi:hypothetical protein